MERSNELFVIVLFVYCFVYGSTQRESTKHKNTNKELEASGSSSARVLGVVRHGLALASLISLLLHNPLSTHQKYEEAHTCS